jgi:hypothetical protein
MNPGKTTGRLAPTLAQTMVAHKCGKLVRQLHDDSAAVSRNNREDVPTPLLLGDQP